ncbi:MAG: N-acetyl-gamma-glutamyl-phosphate reductase [Clostridiales bacterium]|jgi:N-acetyl-gamma-glutamyl-phosphate reductase|nr:N-acetyl-gamma-glutamyl-phosphate reductase [Clostridiales bacterium]
MVKASIIGANGYTGLELMNILSAHKSVTITHLVSVSNKSTRITDMYPSLVGLKDSFFEGVDDLDAISKDSDVIFSCLPHAASAELCGKLFERGVKIIDLSADFRYDSRSVYEKTYKTLHPYPELLNLAAYGLPELYKEKIKKASIVGNPGCYTTCSILPLYPLVKEGIIDADNIIIDAKSGTSGAGKKAETSGLFAEVNENFKAYGVAVHRHTSEIEQEISNAAGRDIALSFTPHLLPVTRGILATIHLKPIIDIDEHGIYEVYRKYYANQPFVLFSLDKLPSLNCVKYSNYISIGFVLDKRLRRLIVVSCIDNLIKGASGQAVQNMNIMFGLDETEGLRMQPRHL